MAKYRRIEWTVDANALPLDDHPVSLTNVYMKGGGGVNASYHLHSFRFNQAK